MRHALRILTGTALAALSISTVHAAGGGGGGTSPSMPSESAPQYDPANDYRLGLEAVRANEHAKAKRYLMKVVGAMPRDGTVNYLLGLSEAGRGDHKAAAKRFEKAVKADKANVAAQQQLGISRAKSGDRPGAEAVLAELNAQSTSCATTCPKAADLKTAVDQVSASLAGTPTAALNPADSALFASERGDFAYLQAVALINERRYDEAIAALNDAQVAFGAHPDVLTYLGFANRKLKRFDVAEGYYRQALAIAPNHRGATEYFGELMVERGDLAGARVMLAKLDRVCAFGCTEAEELRAWVAAGRSPHS